MPERAHSIADLNNLSTVDRLDYLRLLLPTPLLTRFQIDTVSLTDSEGTSLVQWVGDPGRSDMEISLYRHKADLDPLAYFHLTDTVSRQIHILLAVINDPDSPRFDIDRLPDGTKTHFGIFKRNLIAEVAAFQAGLAPGQIHKGLRGLRDAMQAFEDFTTRLGHDIYFIEPLQYHNAIVFERYGFAYQQGRRWMESLNTRFSIGGDLLPKLDGSTPFRQPSAAQSIRGRSWAIQDAILGEPYTGVTMYKRVGQSAGVETFPGGRW